MQETKRRKREFYFPIISPIFFFTLEFLHEKAAAVLILIDISYAEFT
jgi:hypothetical protein